MGMGKPLSGAARRRKGHNWEREVNQLFREAMPGATITRGQQAGDYDINPDGQMPYFWREDKKQKQPNIRKALRQAKHDCLTAGQHTIKWPLAVTKGDRDDALATMSLFDFLELVKEWWELKNR